MNPKSSLLHRTVIHPYFVMFLRFMLGGIMIFAGAIKLIDMPGMAESIENYRLLPHAWVNIPAIILPAVELIAGICLIAGIWIQGALLIITGLFAVFIVAVESAIWRGLNIECGCFGLSDSEIVGVQVLVRDVLFLFATIPIWVTRFGIDGNREALEQSVARSGADV